MAAEEKKAASVLKLLSGTTGCGANKVRIVSSEKLVRTKDQVQSNTPAVSQGRGTTSSLRSRQNLEISHDAYKRNGSGIKRGGNNGPLRGSLRNASSGQSSRHGLLPLLRNPVSANLNIANQRGYNSKQNHHYVGNLRESHFSRTGFRAKSLQGNNGTPLFLNPRFKRLEKLDTESDRDVVLTLANKSSGFEDLIKEKLQVNQFRFILKLLQKVCRSDFDKNKSLIMTQACSCEFLDQFMNLLMQGIKIPPSELKNLLLDMAEFFGEVIKLLPATACDLIQIPLSGCYSCIQTLAAAGTIVLEEMVLDKFKSLIAHLEKVKSGLHINKVNIKKESKKEQMQILPPPNDFREMSIYPNVEDLLVCNRPFLRPNVVRGPYESVEHYLDVQFRLLREDYIRPLREGIADYVRGKSNRKCESLSVRIYTGVKFIKYYKEEQTKPGQRVKEGYVLSFDTSKLNRVNWEHTKRFMHGSLLCFSRNNFQTFLFATVAEHDISELKKGRLLIKFCEKYEENIYQENLPYIMVESEVYFEPYFQVLNTLTSFHEENFPFSQYIVSMQQNDYPPQYLVSEEMETPRKCILRAGRNKFEITVLDTSTWPSATKLGLDQSQHNALEAALTRELVVLQGPPGTGKTFMALKIAETLIRNKEALGRTTPILVVCLTNHALDQFLMEILKVTNKLTRIGGQSKSDELANFNLRKKKNFSRSSASLFHELSDAIANQRNNMKISEAKVETLKSHASIVSLGSLESVVEPHIFAQLRGKYLKWLSGLNVGADEYITEMNNQVISINSLKHTVQNIKTRSLEDLNQAYNSYVINQYQYRQFKDQIEMTYNFTYNAVVQLENLLQVRESPGENAILLLLAVKNPWSLNMVKRWQLYTHWVTQLKDTWQAEIHQRELKLFELQERIEELRCHDDLLVLQESEVVGLTTNGAARLHKLLKLLKCEIVIVEEAAEVMESHVVACLNEHCKHLILIGDHKQLRPSISVYELGRHFNFDVSLFERMVQNRGQCITLGVQHRMAPAMAKLIVPTIYPVLANAKSVMEHQEILGIPHRLFFITHTQPEKQDNEMTSRKNEHEAEFLLALCCHLVLQGYNPQQITILATYRGQMFHMKKELNKQEYSSITGVQITVVDNFQGEENDIILLSLVRSNEEGKIGFLATENRVCVALSRARQGFYIIGNMDILTAASKTWQAVHTSLKEQDAVGPSLTLRCQVHPDQLCDVTTAQDFHKFSPQGGCTQICSVSLDCGHNCDKICHALNQDHSKNNCNQPCIRQCAAKLHDCKNLCFQNCGNCNKIVEKKLSCSHQHPMPCFKEPETFQCKTIVEKEFSDCNHKGFVECFDTKCPLPCENRLPCGHQCLRHCHVNHDPDHLKYFCYKPCEKLNTDCTENHKCKKMCCETCERCFIEVKKKMKCGHEKKMHCSAELNDGVECTVKCTKALECGHLCTRLCSDTCKPCREKVEKILPSCGHTVKTKCGTDVALIVCKENCERKLKCGHPCREQCVEPCTQKCKEKVGVIVSQCGHDVPLFCWENTEGLTLPSDVNRCRKLCKAVLECKHECIGNCSSCRQGRFHVSCQQPCNRILVCGHRCPAPCNIPCPPCTEKCTKKCYHTNCENKCGMPCKPCKQYCNWRCEHFKCNHRCSFPCNRPPCNEPCKKQLSCQHLCAGLCGEICPPLCWECDRDKLLAEAMQQNTQPPEQPRFVVLPDCGHVLEVTGLERWLTWQQSEVHLLTCPRCMMPIVKVKRYQTLIHQTYQDFSTIGAKVNKFVANDLKIKLNLRIKALTDDLQFQASYPHIVKYLTNMGKVLTNSSKQKYQYNMLQSMNLKLLEIQFTVVQNIYTILQAHVISEERRRLLILNSEFILNILDKSKREFGVGVAYQISLEMLRLKHLTQGLYFIENDSSKNKTDEALQFSQHVCQLRCYDQEMQKETENKLKKLQNVSSKVCKDIDIKIQVYIQQVQNFWVKCPDGHLSFAFMPVTKNIATCNEFCDFNINNLECPVFAKTNKKENNTDVAVNNPHKNYTIEEAREPKKLSVQAQHKNRRNRKKNNKKKINK